MPVYISRARLVLITIVSVISVLGGIVLVFRLGTRSGLERLHTYEIVGMLGLLFLPLLTLWAFYADVRAHRLAAARAESVRERAAPDTQDMSADPQMDLFGIDPDEHGHRPVRSWAGAGAEGDALGFEPPDRPGEDAVRERARTRVHKEDLSRIPDAGVADQASGRLD